MKMNPIAIAITFLLSFASMTLAQRKAGDPDPLAANLAAPDSIIEHAEQIGLSSPQRERIQEIMEGAQGEIANGEQKLRAATVALSAELSKSPVDENRALERLDRVLELERLLKRHYLKLLVAINNTLEPGQRQQLLAEPRAGGAGGAGGRQEPAAVTERRLREKVEQLKGHAEALAASGKSPDHIHEMMQTFSHLMEQGKAEEAEALIDQKLQELNREGEGLPDGAAIDPAALRREVETMRVQDVAWRKIEWKTCLLDGIRASREQNKPMILWVFIDRPVDDKRC